MTTEELDQYPRPDFQRSGLTWSSLNRQWDFIFDDDDVGLTQQWHRHALPDHIISSESANAHNDTSAASITRLIAARPEKLLDQNLHARSEGGKVYKKQSIKIPFVFQTPASGINDHDAHEVVWYERNIPDIRGENLERHHDRLLLRFGAVDYEATVWLDGEQVGSHRGGHVPFDIDITDAFADKAFARFTVRVRDSPYDLTQPRGKQYWAAKPESIFYTPSTGIWQSVWLESVPSTRIADSSGGTILRSDDIESGMLHAHVAVLGALAGQVYFVDIEASIGGVVVNKSEKCKVSKELKSARMDLDLRIPEDKRPQSITQANPTDDPTCWLNGLALWSPEYPFLYDLVIRLYTDSDDLQDEVHTTTGMRSLNFTSGDSTIRLNNQPYFQALVLDQGYWPSTGLTPPTQQSLKADILMSKAMGFNGCRKHQKVEDPVFLYWADKLGYLVWGEMASAYEFSNDYVDRFDAEWIEAVKRDINHPCIVAWTTVNETWGYPGLKEDVQQQNHVRSLYYRTKTLDPTRPINDNCGWQHVTTDLTTFHDYSDGPALTKVCQTLGNILKPKSGRDMFVAGSTHKDGSPVLCTEFGGVNIAPKDGNNDGGRESDWGYTTAENPEDLLKRVERLMLGIAEGGHCCGFVYTQLTDIEQEVNGLYTFDRKPKLKVEAVKEIIDRAKDIYYAHIRRKGTVS